MGDIVKDGANSLATGKNSRLWTSLTSILNKSRASRSKSGANIFASNEDPNELISLFECPVCCNYISSPFIQCQNGHLLCETCRTNTCICPICRVSTDNTVRNLPFEKLVSSMVFSCKYSECKIQLSYEEKSTHEDLCLFKPYACPSPTGNNNCSWNGSLEEVMPHLLEHHKNIEVTQGRQVNVALDLNKNARQIWAHIQACHGTWFLFMANREMKANDKEEFNALVQLVGSPKQAKKFNYELKLMKGNRKLIWISIPRSIHEGVQKAIADYDCLSFDRETAKLFISDDTDTGRQNTVFSVRITKRWF